MEVVMAKVKDLESYEVIKPGDVCSYQGNLYIAIKTNIRSTSICDCCALRDKYSNGDCDVYCDDVFYIPVCGM